MKTLKFALLAAGLLAVAPAFAQTAGGTANTGPQGQGNFVAGKPEGSGNFVAGKPEGNGNFVAGKPEGNGNFVGGKPKDPAKEGQAGRPARFLGDLGDPRHIVMWQIKAARRQVGN